MNILDFEQRRILSYAGFLFLVDDSNGFFRRFTAGEDDHVVAQRRFDDHDRLFGQLSDCGIDYHIVLLPDRLCYLMEPLALPYSCPAVFSRRAVRFSSERSYVYYDVDRLGMALDDIVEVRDTHLASIYMAAYLHRAIAHFGMCSAVVVDTLLSRLRSQLVGSYFGGDLFDMLSTNDQARYCGTYRNIGIRHEAFSHNSLFTGLLPLCQKKIFFTYQSSGERIEPFLRQVFPNATLHRNNGDIDIAAVRESGATALVRLLTEKFL